MADTDDKIKLSDAQRAKIERNRQRALLLRQARLSSRPYPEPKLSTVRLVSSEHDKSLLFFRDL